MRGGHFSSTRGLPICELECYLVEGRGSWWGAPPRSLVIRLTGPQGLEGWGEGPALWSSAELAGRQEALAALLVERSAFEIEELSGLEVLREPGVRSAVEMACWDLIGKRMGEPVCHLWGGRYRKHVPLGARLPSLDSGENISRLARELSEQGFHTLVLPGTGQPLEDAARLAELPEAAGGRSRLYLDAAGQYSESAARDLCGTLEYQPIQGIIDPLNTKQVYPFASLARQTGMPIGLHRPLVSLSQVFGAVRSGAGAFVVLDPDLLGGLRGLRKAAAVAEAAGLPALLHEAGGIGIRLAALAHLAAAVGFLDHPCLTETYQPLCQGLEIVEGMVSIPEAAGWGIRIDPAKLEEWQIP